jgi:hypothetical protein
MKSVKIRIGSAFLIVCWIVLTGPFFPGDSRAEEKPAEPEKQRQTRMKKPEAAPEASLCPDISVKLKVVKGDNGLVTLNGTISNKGGSDFNIPSEAQIFMNLSDPPKTYAQMGVSEKLCTKAFTQLKKETAIDFKCDYQIPDFEKWLDDMVVGNPKRLFTLRVVKADMSPFAPGEECKEKNNSKSVEVTYQRKK